MKANTLVVGWEEYWLNNAYCKGALDRRAGYPYVSPAGSESFRSQYDYGHQNEDMGEHIRFGVDVITAPKNGRRFEEDPSVPRDRDGYVNLDWYEKELVNIGSRSPQG